MAPLTQEQKLELASFASFEGGQYVQNASRMAFRAIKYTIKEIIGVEDALTGKPYELEFDDQGVMKEHCVNDILNMGLDEKLLLACLAMVRGVPTEIMHDGKKLEGVEILPIEAAIKKNISPPSNIP